VIAVRLLIEGGPADGLWLTGPFIPATLELSELRAGLHGRYRFAWALANGRVAVYVPTTPQPKEHPPC
jgi:hypothetical protein